MNKLGRGLQEATLYTKYQSSSPYSFREEFSFFVPMFQLATPGGGPVLARGASYEQTW